LIGHFSSIPFLPSILIDVSNIQIQSDDRKLSGIIAIIGVSVSKIDFSCAPTTERVHSAQGRLSKDANFWRPPRSSGRAIRSKSSRHRAKPTQLRPVYHQVELSTTIPGRRAFYVFGAIGCFNSKANFCIHTLMAPEIWILKKPYSRQSST
jgi:hypothetical protein